MKKGIYKKKNPDSTDIMDNHALFNKYVYTLIKLFWLSQANCEINLGYFMILM